MRAPVSETWPPYPLPNPYPLKNNFVVSTTKRRGWERGWEKLGKGEKNPIQSPSKNIMLTQYQGKNETKQKQTKNQSWQVKEILQSLKILITFLIITDSASIQWLLDF